MLVAVTGATGFVGRYVVNYLLKQGHSCRAWMRPSSDIRGFCKEARSSLHFVPGVLGDLPATKTLVEGVDAVVHAAIAWPKGELETNESQLLRCAQHNLIGTLTLMEVARTAGVPRFIFISSCGVHDLVPDTRKVDETNYICPTTHYGAYKASVEKFVHSFGLGHGWDICALRPAGVYGLSRPLNRSRWFPLVRSVMDNKPIHTARGSRVVHAIDVARAILVLLRVAGVAGQIYDCSDVYISDEQVARLAKRIVGSTSTISALGRGPTHEIDTRKLRSLGMHFGGQILLEKTIAQMINLIQVGSDTVSSPYLQFQPERVTSNGQDTASDLTASA